MRKDVLIVLALVLLIGIGVWFRLSHSSKPTTENTGSTATTTTVIVRTLTTAGGLTIRYSEPYGLATTPEQVLARAYIPPCDPPFDYCFYRSSTTYAGTNFESAGLRIKKRDDLQSEYACLTTLPEGYSNLTPKTAKGSAYATSLFPSLSDAAAGHYSAGDLHRLFFSKTCYEFQTRIGEAQYDNYPAGAITKFTDENRASVQAELRDILSSVRIGTTSTKILFPEP